MIIRISNMRAVSKSSFVRAVRYVVNSQGKAQRVGLTLTLNCLTQDINQSLIEMSRFKTKAKCER